MPPTWLRIISRISLVLAFATAALILFDIYGRGHRQQMGVMEAVWPVTAPYFGPLAWLGYRRWARPSSPSYREKTGEQPDYPERISVGIGVSHCGAGCTLGDIAGPVDLWLIRRGIKEAM